MIASYNPNTNRSVRVILGFPGVGKSTASRILGRSHNLSVLDTDEHDSSKSASPNFPHPYVDYILSAIAEGEYDVIFVTSHKAVRDALIDAGVSYTLVYPARSLRDTYVQRYRDRESPGALIDIISNNWDNWLEECETLAHPRVRKVVLANPTDTLVDFCLERIGLDPQPIPSIYVRWPGMDTEGVMRRLARGGIATADITLPHTLRSTGEPITHRATQEEIEEQLQIGEMDVIIVPWEMVGVLTSLGHSFTYIYPANTQIMMEDGHVSPEDCIVVPEGADDDYIVSRILLDMWDNARLDCVR